MNRGAYQIGTEIIRVELSVDISTFFCVSIFVLWESILPLEKNYSTIKSNISSRGGAGGDGYEKVLVYFK